MRRPAGSGGARPVRPYARTENGVTVFFVTAKVRRDVPPLGLLLAALMILIASVISGGALVSYSHTIPSGFGGVGGNGVVIMPLYSPITVDPQVEPTSQSRPTY
jgi:hypothetical protein